MNSDCQKIKDQIADLVTGILSEAQVQALEQHLNECAACRDYARALKNEDMLLTELFAKIDKDMTSRQERVLQAVNRSYLSEQTETLSIRRIIMKSSITKLAIAAAIIVVAALSITTVVDKLATPAYAIVQTYEALKNVRFMHIIGRDDASQINDERWIEIGMDGFQVRYRQDKPPHPFAIEDGESTARYRHDKKAVIIYDRKDRQYQWVGELGKALENLRQEGKILEENGDYQGQLAHKVWWPYMSAECYVDPGTQLAIAIGDTELSYEEPPAETFEIFIPEGYVVLDKRPGAVSGSVPDWLLEEERASENASECFNQATHALAQGDYVKAAELFEVVTEHQSGRNWAWFWLGSAYYEQGKYDLAIEKFTKVLEIFKAFGGGGDKPLNYCNYARGLAYARLAMNDAAEADLQVCLPSMIRTLRIPSSGKMFEYADNPLMRYGKYNPTEQQIVINMINRLRIVSGQNFGYDPDATDQENEAAITAWEQWLESDRRINVTFDAELVGVPAASDLPQ
jgi:tetratricopeptide (TPR) repeat protein